MLKQLAGHTLVYGLSSVLGRVVNFILTPLYTWAFVDSVFGSMSVIYSYVAFLAVILTFGMETTYFKYSNVKGEREDKVFGTTFLNVVGLNGIFLIVSLLLSQKFGNLLGLEESGSLVFLIIGIVAMDAISALPLARLRNYSQPQKFAFIQLTSIVVNLGLNSMFLLLFPWLQNNMELNGIYNEEYQLYYVFISNFASSLVKFGLAFYTTKQFPTVYSFEQFKKYLIYAWPVAIAGVAAMVNETLDRIMLDQMLTGSNSEVKGQIGIYSANYKLTVLMTMFVQAYRYAAEPLFFRAQESDDGPKKYANALKWFFIVSCFGFLCITLFLPLLQKLFIRDASYWEGIVVVPILLIANMFLGLYVNLSTWYKVSDKTQFGARYALIGASVTILLNLILIPILGYYGCAIATLAAYATMTIFSYAGSRTHYPIPYNLRQILFYSLLTAGIYVIGLGIDFDNAFLNNFARLLLLLPFIFVVLKLENITLFKNGNQSHQ